MSKNIETIQGVFDAMNRRDVDAAVAAYADDATLTSYVDGDGGRGRDEIRGMYERWFAALSDAKYTVDRLIDAGDAVIVQGNVAGTFDGTLGPLQGTGRRAELPFCNVVRFDGAGKVVLDEVYADNLSFMIQLGVIEPPVSE